MVLESSFKMLTILDDHDMSKFFIDRGQDAIEMLECHELIGNHL